jgi:zinc protease
MKKYFLFFFLFTSVGIAQEIRPVTIIQNYLEAIGGIEKIKALKDISMQLEGEMQGQKINVIILKKQPGKLFTDMTVDGMGSVNKIIFDGTKGSMSAMGSDQSIDEETAKALKAQAVMIGEAAYLQDTLMLKYSGKEVIDEVECHKLLITTVMGEAQEFYEVLSGLKKRQINKVDSPMGQTTIIMTYDDYKEVKGIKFPFKTHQDLGAVAFELEIKNISINSDLADTLFEVK